MATLNDLLRLRKPNIGNTLINVATALRGGTPQAQEEDTTARDLMLNLIQSRLDTQKDTAKELRKFERDVELENIKAANKKELEEIKRKVKAAAEVAKPPKTSEIAGTGEKGRKTFATVDGQTVPISPVIEKPLDTTTRRVADNIRSSADLAELIRDIQADPDQFIEAGVNAGALLDFFGVDLENLSPDTPRVLPGGIVARKR